MFIPDKLKILVVEDNHADFRFLKELLSENSGLTFELVQAETLQKAQDLLVKQVFDLIFLDLNLPDGMGIKNIEAVSNINKRVPVIVLTGIDDEKVGLLSLQKGAQDYLVKGKIQKDSLVRCIHYAIERQNVEDNLRTERNKLAAIIDNASVGIAVTDEKGGTVHTNSLFEKIWGNPMPQARDTGDYKYYKAWWENGKPVLPEEWASAQVIKTGKPVVNQLLRIQRFNGETAFIINSATPIFDSQGKISGSVIAITDISERKEIESLLRQKSKEEQIILDSVPAMVFYKDKNNRLIRVNDSFEKIMDLPKDKLEGRRIEDLYPKKQAEAFWKDDLEVIKTGKPKLGIIEYMSTAMGTRVVQTDKIPHFDEEGNVKGIIGFAIDITERKIVEEELKRERESLQAIFDVVNTGMLLIDDEGKVKKINRTVTVWLGKDFSSITDRRPGNILNCVYALSEPQGCGNSEHCSTCLIRKTFEKVIHSGKSLHNIEVQTNLILAGKNNNLWLEINADPMILENKRHVILSVNNITLRKQAEEILKRDKETFEVLVNEKTRELINVELKLEQAKRLSDIGTLAATVAHELRNPLAAIKMAAYNAQRKAQNPILDKHFSNIEIKVHESENIIDNLLFYSKIKVPHLAPINIHNILNVCIKDAKSRFPEYKVAIFRKDDALKSLLIEADAVQIKEVFTNLLINSFDATGPKGGRIELKATIEGDNVKFSVKDNGMGIDKADLENIFQPFFSTKAKGTGLGLTVAQQVVKLHGGRIELQSQPGKGTTVNVILPIKNNLNA